jgi:hypothetical protein
VDVGGVELQVALADNELRVMGVVLVFIVCHEAGITANNGNTGGL